MNELNTDVKSSPATTSTQDFIDVKTEMKSDLDRYGGNTNLTRRWITCPGGILKEVKAELTSNVSEILPIEHCIENVDEKPFMYTHNVKVYERTCTSMKPFKCDICEKSFTDSSSLKRHVRTHTGVKPFTCDVCGKSFTASSNLKTHETTHTGVKPFTCDVCGKSCTGSRTPKRHEITHTSLKPFTYVTCGKSFARKSNLNKHEVTHRCEPVQL